ncbi:MAG: hypothetical protein ACM3UT_13045 [Chloroflexota bacterium]
MKSFIFALLLLVSTSLLAQELPLVTDKPGTFEILSRTDYTMSECGFSKAEIESNLKRIKDLVATMRLNPVLSDIKGFNGRARIHTVSMCKYKEQYGLPVRIAFEFCSFFRNRAGEVKFNTIEPPNVSFYINTIVPWGYDFNAPKKDVVSGFFTVPLDKKTLAPGIDLYDGEIFIIYDPSRPDYWVPVTVDEAFACAYEELKKESDELSAKMQKEFIDKEYAEIPVTDRNKPAYFGGGIARVTNKPGFGGQDNLFPRIMKVNPDYWNKDLPKSAIQIIYFRAVQNKEYLRRLCDEYLSKNSISYHSVRFEESLEMDDFQRLKELLGK